VDTLAFLANASHYQVRSGLSPYSELTCLAHTASRQPLKVVCFFCFNKIRRAGRFLPLPFLMTLLSPFQF
jgi:hypothetical protein